MEEKEDMYRRHVDELSEEIRKRDDGNRDKEGQQGAERDRQQGAERDRMGQEIRKMGEEMERLRAERDGLVVQMDKLNN